MKTDFERLKYAAKAANLLVSDLRQLMDSENPYLQELTIEILEQVCKIEQKLLRLRSISEA